MEDLTPDTGVLTPVNIASALFFESPVDIFTRVHREFRPRSATPPINVEYRTFANADSMIRLHSGAITAQITDLLDGAPAPVIEALAHILLGKLYRKPAARQYTHRYRLYMNRGDIRKRMHGMRQERGRKIVGGPEGAVHNLIDVFEALNVAHFGGMMARPDIGWSRVRSRTRLGHYDPSHGMIVISRIFDDPNTPRLALDYVMFHEMLHLCYPVDHSGSRRCVHTPEFKAHEKQFPHYKEARVLLKSLPLKGMIE